MIKHFHITMQCRVGLQMQLNASQSAGMLKGDLRGVLWALSSLLMARRELLPFIQDGNRGCGGRLR